MLSTVFINMPPSPPCTSRLQALKVLTKWHNTHRPIHGIVEQVAADAQLSPMDSQLAKAIIFGVLRQQQYLDFVLTQFARHPLHKMKPRTLFALRIGLFQLLLLDRIPDSAAVNETINAFKDTRQPKWLINFVHGVLRNVARKKMQVPEPNVARQHGRPILNHPNWLIKRWQKYFGPDNTVAICRQNNNPPSMTLRTNTCRISRENLLALLLQKGYKAQATSFSREGISLLEATGSPTNIPGYASGFFQVQDEAAQLASYLLPMRQGIKVLDACAGLGGKTSHMAALAPDSVPITAVEPEERRFQLLKKNLQRLGCDQVRTQNMGLEEFAGQTGEQFDVILLDAPCSGTGVIGRQPDIRWNRRPEDLISYQQQQLLLLNTAAALVQDNGSLIYATCSLEPEENHEVVSSFLRRQHNFRLDNIHDIFPAQAARLVSKQKYFQPLPIDGLDGFFAVRLCRTK